MPNDPIPSPLLNDYPPGQVHVVPDRDANDHLISLTEVCWCQPTRQDEGSGYVTVIHRPQRPVVRGHTLEIRKLHVTAAGVTEMPR